ncbi:MAG: hypothetical protein RL095_22 [Verrucomicrobiota bacterium]|jgi:hypothetical protein
MIVVNGHKNKNTSRPRKTGAAKRQRTLIQQKRLAALGVCTKKISQMTPADMRKLLKHPCKTQAACAAAK